MTVNMGKFHVERANFFVSPWVNGYEHMKLAFKDTGKTVTFKNSEKSVSDIGKKLLQSQSSQSSQSSQNSQDVSVNQKKITMKDRVVHFIKGSAHFLFNYILEIVLRVFFDNYAVNKIKKCSSLSDQNSFSSIKAKSKSKLMPKPGSEFESQEQSNPKVKEKLKVKVALRGLVDGERETLTENIKNRIIEEQKKDLTGLVKKSTFENIIDRLRVSENLNKEAMREIVDRVKEYFLKEKYVSLEGNSVSESQRDYFVYMLENQYQEFLVSKSLKNLHNESDVPVTILSCPADGNCFLWTVAMMKVIRDTRDREKKIIFFKNNDLTSKEVKNSSTFKHLKRTQKKVRKELLNTFLEMFTSADSVKKKEFTMEFLVYLLSKRGPFSINEKEFSLALENEAELQKLANRYVTQIKKDGTFNAGFEASLLASYFQVPVVILEGEGNSAFRLQTIAGSEFISANKPLFVRYSGGNHYDYIDYPYTKEIFNGDYVE